MFKPLTTTVIGSHTKRHSLRQDESDGFGSRASQEQVLLVLAKPFKSFVISYFGVSWISSNRA